MPTPLKLILLTIMIAVSKPCFAQVGSGDSVYKLPPDLHVFMSDSEHVYFFKDADVFKLPTGETKVCGTTITPSEKIKNKTYHKIKTKILWVIDCRMYQIKTVEVIYYSSKNEVLEDTRSEFSEYKDAVPGSIGGQILDEVCKVMKP